MYQVESSKLKCDFIFNQYNKIGTDTGERIHHLFITDVLLAKLTTVVPFKKYTLDLEDGLGRHTPLIFIRGTVTEKENENANDKKHAAWFRVEDYTGSILVRYDNTEKILLLHSMHRQLIKHDKLYDKYRNLEEQVKIFLRKVKKKEKKEYVKLCRNLEKQLINFLVEKNKKQKQEHIKLFRYLEKRLITFINKNKKWKEKEYVQFCQSFKKLLMYLLRKKKKWKKKEYIKLYGNLIMQLISFLDEKKKKSKKCVDIAHIRNTKRMFRNTVKFYDNCKKQMYNTEEPQLHERISILGSLYVFNNELCINAQTIHRTKFNEDPLIEDIRFFQTVLREKKERSELSAYVKCNSDTDIVVISDDDSDNTLIEEDPIETMENKHFDDKIDVLCNGTVDNEDMRTLNEEEKGEDDSICLFETTRKEENNSFDDVYSALSSFIDECQSFLHGTSLSNQTIDTKKYEKTNVHKKSSSVRRSQNSDMSCSIITIEDDDSS